MIGSDTGCWFSYHLLPDGRVDWEFYRYEFMVDQGVTSADEMAIRFQALDAAAKLPLQ